MTEEQADYVTEAMELLHGEPSLVIEPERTVIERRNGELKEVIVPAFIKVSTSFKGELAGISDAALKVWIYIALSVNRNTGKAHPGLRTIAKALGKGVNTIQECLQELEAAKLLQVNRQTRKYNIYEPTAYVSANRIDPVSGSDTDAETVSEKAGSVSEKQESVSGSGYLTRGTREPDTFFAFEELKANHQGEGWEGREIFMSQDFPLVDWYHKVTGQTCPKNKRKDWMMFVSVCRSNRLTPVDLQAAYDMDIKWRGVFTSPNQLTDKAVALKAQRQAAPEEEKVRLI